MRNQLIPLLLTSIWILSPGSILLAQDNDPVDTQAVMERANNLKDILDRLLVDSNDSSIQKVIREGGESSEPLIAEALRLKSSGEQLLAEKQYMKAAITLQSALDHVFQAIRAEDNKDESADALNVRLAEKITVNDTFLSAASRVVTGEPNKEASDLLAMAKEARSRADTDSGNGDLEAALEELEQSTRLAQQAIMSVRNGMVIERPQ
jgi:hypothetical protein